MTYIAPSTQYIGPLPRRGVEVLQLAPEPVKYPAGVLFTFRVHPKVRAALPPTLKVTTHVRRAIFCHLATLANHTTLPVVPTGKARVSLRLPHPQLGQVVAEAQRLNTKVPTLLRYLLTIHAAAFLRGEPDPYDALTSSRDDTSPTLEQP